MTQLSRPREENARCSNRTPERKRKLTLEIIEPPKLDRAHCTPVSVVSALSRGVAAGIYSLVTAQAATLHIGLG